MEFKTGTVDLAGLFEALGRSRTEQVRVGKASEETTKAYQELGKERKRLLKEIEQKTKEFADQLRAEFEPQTDDVERRSLLLWETVYDELGIPEEQREEEFELNPDTGVVLHTRKKQSDDAPDGPLN